MFCPSSFDVKELTPEAGHAEVFGEPQRVEWLLTQRRSLQEPGGVFPGRPTATCFTCFLEGNRHTWVFPSGAATDCPWHGRRLLSAKMEWAAWLLFAFVAVVVLLLFVFVVLFVRLVLVFVRVVDDKFENTCARPTCAWHTSPYLPVYCILQL